MAHCIERLDTTFSIRGTEWHGLANHVEKITLETAASCFFPIVCGTPSVDIETGEYDEAGMPIMKVIHLVNNKAVLADLQGRTDLPEDLRTFHSLHTPKQSYRPISNLEIWDCMQKAIQGLDIEVSTIGTLDNCQKFYISCDLKGGDYRASNGDKFGANLNFLTSHDGTMMFEARDSMVRIVCMNTFQCSRAYDGAMKVAVPHTKNAGISIDNLGEYLQTVLTGRQKIMNSMDYLLSMEASPTEATYAAAAFLSGGRDELTTNAYNRAEEIGSLTKGGIGNSGNTRYDIFNGFTEYFTHHAGAGGKNADKKRRWSASSFGEAAKKKEDFLDLLTNEEEYRETVAIGEKLVKEYALV